MLFDETTIETLITFLKGYYRGQFEMFCFEENVCFFNFNSRCSRAHLRYVKGKLQNYQIAFLDI